ncbi:ABC transporter permease [Stackebrandtia nassauensis]|uniref:Transmembrane transport protein n=1 Tax=Stackebrandtia nassauensis (strain DSM 44728 / CIP 108903 / NRRL B-16338 / NBRC 102104 / LLR-40K-21) TaxID=446470 RepID=D3Q252_STANL|nr:ABC transporter permease [Stackebrandtia nassauensis]ADD41919.1 hypothetical protein Snas_2229 [Stackebrandtia nassauensis DSM 44728]
MIWVAWRQHRAGVLTALAVLATAATVMLVMRLSIDAAFAKAKAPDCLTNPGSCTEDAFNAVMNSYGMYVTMAPTVLYLFPVLLGIVAGAPVFARELSLGTHMFSLTQSVSRKRWWAVKLGVTLLPIAVGTCLLGLLSAWAIGPLVNMLGGRIQPGFFEVQGLVMAGYMVFAFAVASTFGLLTRNNVVPMVVTAGVFIAVAVTVAVFARPSYLPAEQATVTNPKGQDEFAVQTPEHSWRVGEIFVDKDDNTYTSYAEVCNPESCVEDDVVSYTVEYHPDSRFWTFQGIETGAYLVLGAAALAVGARRLRALP